MSRLPGKKNHKLESSGKDGGVGLFKPVWQSFLLLNSRQRSVLLLIVGLRVVVHGLDLLGLAGIGLLGTMFAGGLDDQSQVTFFGVSVDVTRSTTFLAVAVAIGLFFLIKSVVGTVLLRVTTVFLGRVEASAAGEVARYLFSGDITRVRSMSKGEIQWAVSTSTNLAFSTMLLAGSAVVTESTLFLAVFAAFLFVDVSTALVISAYFVILVGLFQVLINQRLRRLGIRLKHNAVQVNNSILDMAAAFREVSVLEKRSFFLNRFREARGRLASDSALQRFVLGFPRFFVEAALMVGIMGLVVWQFVSGTLSNGLLLTGIFLAGGLRMMAAMLPLQNALTDIRIQSPQATRAQELIRESRQHGEPREETSSPGLSAPNPRTQNALSVTAEKLSFTYADADQPVLREVSFDVPPGAFVAFIGPSGAGKSTLVDLILGLHRPSSGVVSIGGLAPDRLREAWPGAVSYVPQKPGMVSGTVAENIALGEELPAIDWIRLNRAVAQAGLEEMVEAMPDGVMTSLGRQSDSLSGGQLQRLGIARALYPGPRLIVLDEATSALDAETEASISSAIYALRGDVTVISVAHRLSTIQHADTVFVVEEGQLSASGSLSQVRKKVPLIERYVELLTISEE